MSVTNDVLDWNETYPEGTKVRYWPGIKEGPGREGETRSEAWDLCGTAVVKVTGYAGGIALSHIEVMRT